MLMLQCSYCNSTTVWYENFTWSLILRFYSQCHNRKLSYQRQALFRMSLLKYFSYKSKYSSLPVVLPTSVPLSSGELVTVNACVEKVIATPEVASRGKYV